MRAELEVWLPWWEYELVGAMILIRWTAGRKGKYSHLLALS